MEAIVDKFLRFLDNQINSFNQITTAYMNETAIIKEHKKALTEEIKNYSDDNTEGFNYTIREDIPDLSLVDNFNASLFDNLFHSGVNDLSVDSVKETISAMQLEQDVRNFRARILGMDGELSDNEFVNQLRLVFRDNVSGAIELDIDEKSIKTIAEQWFSKYGFKSQLTEQYKKIEKSYQGLMKKVSAICKNNNGLTVSAFTNLMPGDIGVEKIEGKDINNNGMMMSADMMLQIDIYTKAKLDQLQKYTDVTCMVMGAKMDAMKDKIRQDRGILLKAIEVLDHPDDYYDAREPKGKANRNATMASVEAPSEDDKPDLYREKEPMAENTINNYEIDISNLNEAATKDIKQILYDIHKEYEKYNNDGPAGNQNCLLCTWAAEAQIRGYDILPRPVYSPRDTIFNINGWDIVTNDIQMFYNLQQLKNIIINSGDGSRYYAHVNWKNSNGGHEFILLNDHNNIMVVDAQQGIYTNINSKQGRTYTDMDFKNSFIVRLDDCEIDIALIEEYNDRSKIVYWNDDIDIPYMKEHNMINESVNNNIYHLFEQNLNDKTLTSRITDNFLVKNEYDDKGILLKKPGKEDSDND